jgi:hypothetical protein
MHTRKCKQQGAHYEFSELNPNSKTSYGLKLKKPTLETWVDQRFTNPTQITAMVLIQTPNSKSMKQLTS